VALFEEPTVNRRLPLFALAEVENEWDFGQDELEIVFKVSKIEIDSTVFDNEATFGKILQALDKIYQNPAYKLSKLHVGGYASPEGPQKFNTWLGINRAKALINYIIEHRPEYDLKMENFEIHNGEENWAGLRRVLEVSQMKGKEEVIAVIDRTDLTGEAKKREIKKMDQGKVWEKMLKEIYPKLRCARYLAVYYDSADDHAVEIINQSNVLIREGRYQEAHESLMKVADDARAFNSIGVSLMMQGQFEEAMPWFEKALEYDHSEAQNNIDAINAEYRYENDQKAAIEEYLKKFE
jgi:tetratricopeptide (TPR) repeat protein